MKRFSKLVCCILIGVIAEVSEAGCVNDFSCTYGQKCVKPEGSYAVEGICVTPVDKYSNQDFKPIVQQTRPIEVSRCSFDTECSVGESCIKKGYDLYGICAK